MRRQGEFEGTYKLTWLREVEPISVSRGDYMITEERIKEIIDLPLVRAVLQLYRLNIETRESEANKGSIGRGNAYIVINFDSLSQENKEVALQLKESGVARIDPNDTTDGYVALYLDFPVDEDTMVQDVEDRSVKTANRFVLQRMTWAPTKTWEVMVKTGEAGDLSEQEYMESDYYKNSNTVYDLHEHTLYLVAEHYEKTHGAIPKGLVSETEKSAMPQAENKGGGDTIKIEKPAIKKGESSYGPYPYEDRSGNVRTTRTKFKIRSSIREGNAEEEKE